MPAAKSTNIACTWPPITSVIAGGVLLYGTCSIFRPAIFDSVAPATMPVLLPLA
ncbi:hypothetical protein D3C81_2302900 [compost metagenome]